MSFREEFALLLRARYPIVYIPTYEEERAEVAIREEARIQGNRAVYNWDFVDGYQGNPNDAGFGRRNPLQALEFVEKLPASAPAVFILRDFHRFLEDVSVSRKLRNLARVLKSQPKNIVLLSPRIVTTEERSPLTERFNRKMSNWFWKKSARPFAKLKFLTFTLPLKKFRILAV
jgi:hypothetical protein